MNNHNATNVINFTRTIILSNLLAISQLTNHRKIYPCHKAFTARWISFFVLFRIAPLFVWFVFCAPRHKAQGDLYLKNKI